MSMVKNIGKNAVIVLLFIWSSILCAADILELQHRNDMYVKDFDGITFRLSVDQINIEEILAKIKDINAIRFVIFVKHVKEGETQGLIDALNDPLPNFSYCSYGLGPKSLLLDLASNGSTRSCNYRVFNEQSINQKSLLDHIASWGPYNSRNVWFFEKTSTKKMKKLVDAIRNVYSHPSYFKITTWLIDGESGMIEIDWR